MAFELIYKGERLDFESGGIDNTIALNKLLLDLNFIKDRGGDFSNKFKIPASKNNNKLFQHFYHSGSQFTRDLVTGNDFSIIDDGVEVFNGKLRVENVVKKFFPEFYKVQALGKNLTWAIDLKSLKINELTLPEVDYDEATVRDSWDNTYVDGYVAPLVVYGQPTNYQIESAGKFPSWEGVWEYTDFRYWVFLKPLIEEMFEKIGWTIECSFLESDEFKEFIIYCNDFDIYNQASGASPVPLSINLKTDLFDDTRLCLDLLKGVQNKFNLFFFTDDINKVVYMEKYGDFFSTEVVDINGKVDVSKNVEISINKGVQILKNLRFKYEEDALAERLKSYSIFDYSYLPSSGAFHICDVVFDESIDRQDVENNFFGSYLTMAVSLDRPIIGGGTGGGFYAPYGSKGEYDVLMPAVLDQPFEDRFEAVPGIGAIFPYYYPIQQRSSGKVKPLFGRYGGWREMKTITGDPFLGSFKYAGDVGRAERPFMYLADYRKESVDPQNYHYSDITCDLSSEENMSGLVNKFYKRFLASFNGGRRVKLNVKYNSIDFFNTDTRNRIGYDDSQWILLELNDFRVGGADSAQMILLQDLGVIDGVDYNVKKNGERVIYCFFPEFS